MLPYVDGVITADEIAETADSIARLQLPNGMIPWFPGGHCDPWNHVETAMALAVTGRFDEARRAYRWLADVQRPDGSWHNYYRPDGSLEDAKLDTNVCAYVAAGVWHYWLLTKDSDFVDEMFPVVERALDWVIDLQKAGGEIVWAREVESTPWDYALLTGSSSICHALSCGRDLAEVQAGERHPDWELAAMNLADVIRNRPQVFEPKERWAMDWYYPVLTGVLTGAAANDRLASRRSAFVLDGLGVRCVDDEPWVTAAETCECAMAYAAVGDDRTASDLLSWTRAHRHPDGSYSTGIVYPQRVTFPDGERSAYTAAAVILATDAISATSAASDLFVGAQLPIVTGEYAED